MQNKTKILFIYPIYSSFVKSDYEILSEKYTVIKHNVVFSKHLFSFVFTWFKEFFFLAINIWKVDSVFIWFADYHSFLPVFFAKIAKKKSFIVVGGYDVACIKELNYGSFVKPFRGWCTKFSLKYSTLNLAVVESLEKRIIEIVPQSNTKTVYTGYKNTLDYNVCDKQITKTVLTISITGSKQRMLIKGLDRFIELAQIMPDYEFTIVGITEKNKNLLPSIPSNLKILPPQNFESLIKIYSENTFYAQFSRSEGLPNAICEAMLYGCIAIGTDIGGIKTAIGDCGFVNLGWNAVEYKNFILNLSNDNINKLKINGKDRVLNKFNFRTRKSQIINIIEQKNL